MGEASDKQQLFSSDSQSILTLTIKAEIKPILMPPLCMEKKNSHPWRVAFSV